MRRVLLLLLISATTCTQLFSQIASGTVIGNQTVIDIPVSSYGTMSQALRWLPDDYNSTTKKYPLLIFLHGSGEGSSDNISEVLGTSLPQLIAQGLKPYGIDSLTGDTVKYIVISPHASYSYWSYQYVQVKPILQFIEDNYRVDTNRVFMTGLSAGGYGDWTCVTDDTDFVKRKITGVIPCSPAEVEPEREANLKNAAIYGLAVWIVCGTADAHYAGAQRYHDIINSYNPTKPNELIGIVGADHNSSAWNPPFTLAFNKFGGKNLYTRMLDYTRATGPAALSASAGVNQTITLPISSVTLNGSGSPGAGHSIVSYAWSKISGPATYTITSPSSASTTVTGLIVGTYVFRLTVTDDASATVEADVQVTVNAANIPPVANAGSDVTITLPTNSVTVTGTGTDADGTIASYLWTKVAGPAQFTIVSANQAQTVINNLVQGSYKFELRVTDNQGGIARDTMAITVNAAPPPPNQSPVANAGNDQTITLPTNTVTVIGSGTDADGTIASYLWTKVAGPAQFTIVSSNQAQTDINGLVQGTYTFELQVTDNLGAIGKDSVLITVNPAPPPTNQAPTASAGPDQTITFPTNMVTLLGAGTDVDGTIVSYAWTKLSGSGGTITSPSTTSTTVTGLNATIYKFIFTVTDNNGATGKDTMQVTVNPAVNAPPVVNVAAASINITLPLDQVTLDGSGSTDPGGSITAYAWVKVSGPATGTITSPSSATTTVTGLTNGVYVFRLTVTDNSNSTSSAAVQVTVNTQVICGGQKRIIIPGVEAGIYLNGSSFTYNPGDTFVLKSQYNTWSYFALENFSGTSSCPITIINEGGQVKLINGISFTNCQYMKVTGSGSADQYGFSIRDTATIPGGPGIGINRKSKNIEVERVVITRKDYGFLIKNEADCDTTLNFPNWVLDSMSVHDCKITNMQSQGFYMGSTDPNNSARPIYCAIGGVQTEEFYLPTRLGNIKIYNNIVDSTGRPGIQLSAAQIGMSEIYNNSVNHAGSQMDDAQGSGIVLGGYSRAYIHDNTVKNTYTWGIASIGGAGLIRIENNTIDSAGHIYGQSVAWPPSIIIDTRRTVPADSTQFIIKNNVVGVHGISEINDIAVAYTSDLNTYAVGNIICNNTKIGGLPAVFDIAPNIVWATCNGIPNQLPIANAGPDQTITLPLNNVWVAGTGIDADGTIVAFKWTKVSGPAQYTIAGPVYDGTFINNLVAGVYQFEFQAIDNQGGIGRDTLTITVISNGSNQPPVANAGPDQTISLPTNSITLTGSGTDADGTIVSYSWTKITGPSQYNITSPSSAQTTVTNLVQGVYQFQLVVTDDSGATGTNTVIITVNPTGPPPTNQPPVANAGPDQSTTLPTNSIILNGSGTDPDGIVVGYNWTEISGPSQYTIITPDSAQTTLNNLVQGVYQFQLMVTDNAGATGKDTVTITVNPGPPPPNQPPVANAGSDQSITLPTNSVILSGTGTDADGSIVGYSWIMISGPAQFTIVNPANALTAVNNLVQGFYQFQLQVTDNDGATARDTVFVTVNPAGPPPPNQPPVANAGNDITITLPINSVVLQGSGSDTDGTVVSYSWTKIAGPSQFSILSPSLAQTIVNNLIQGVYSFELKVTDNLGAIGRDTVIVTVNSATARLPVAEAGENKVIFLPRDTLTLDGVGVSPDGTITNYNWRKLDGPGQISMLNPSSPVTVVANLVEGTYDFEFSVIDNFGAIAKDTMSVVVKIISESKVTIFPNPTTSIINIKIDAKTHSSLTLVNIYDVTGRRMFSETFMRSEFSIVKQVNMAGLANGTYFVEVTADINHRITNKVIKQ